MYYKEKITLNDNAFDNFGNIIPFHVLKIFQDAATAHGTLLGVGEERMKELNLFWIISQLKYEVVKPTKERELWVKTWPLEPGNVGFLRNYLILDSKEEVVVKASANWLTVSRDERKLKIGRKVFPPMEFAKELNFGKKIPRLRDFEDGSFALDIVPKNIHIDSNGHVNNKHYTTFISEATGGFEGVISTFQIDYALEIMPGDKVDIIVHKNDKEVLFKGESSDRKHFYARIEYK